MRQALLEFDYRAIYITAWSDRRDRWEEKGWFPDVRWNLKPSRGFPLLFWTNPECAAPERIGNTEKPQNLKEGVTLQEEEKGAQTARGDGKRGWEEERRRSGFQRFKFGKK